MNVLAITHLDDSLFVTRVSVAQVSVYDTKSFQLMRQITFAGLSDRLFGLATSLVNHYLYIADYLNMCVHRVDLSATYNISLKFLNLSASPYDVSMTSTSSVLVLTDDNSISEYTPAGSLVRKVFYTNPSWYAMELSTNLWVFSNRGSVNGVVAISTNGTVTRSFVSAPGSGQTQMNDVRSFAIDSNGYILAADRGNNRIQVVNPTMTAVRQLTLTLTDLQCPIAIDIDQSHGRLYIGEDCGQQRVLVFDGFP